MAGRRRKRSHDRSDQAAVLVLLAFVLLVGSQLPARAVVLGVVVVAVGALVSVVRGRTKRRTSRRRWV